MKYGSGGFDAAVRVGGALAPALVSAAGLARLPDCRAGAAIGLRSAKPDGAAIIVAMNDSASPDPRDPAPAIEIAGSLRIVDFQPRWRADFARLNIEWLERWFSVEPIDREVLNDPETHLLAGGGRVLFAIDDRERALGTVALLRYDDGLVELTKMAVEPGLRGGGIGRKLMAGAIAAFHDMGGRELFLESSLRLGPALKLYESVGFRHHPAPRPGSHYQRADVYMIWEAPPAS